MDDIKYLILAVILVPVRIAMKIKNFSFVLLASFAVAVHVKRDNATGNYTGSPCSVVSQSARAALALSYACI